MKLTKSLAGKISLGYVTIAVVTVLASILSLFILRSNKDIDQEISEYSVPALVLYKDLNALNNELKRLCNSWIYTPNQADKQNLQNILKVEYPALGQRIEIMIQNPDASQDTTAFKTVLASFNQIVSDAHLISSGLSTDEDYADDSKVDAALKIYEKLVGMFANNDKLIDNSIKKYGDSLTSLQVAKNRSYQIFTIVLVCMLLAILVTGFVSLSISRKIIIAPINALKERINKLGQGELSEMEEDEQREDEIGEMGKSILNMMAGFKSKTDFALAIGKGDYEKDYQALSAKDDLGNALLEMRANLKSNAENERKRSWATSGIASMGELLRKSDSNEEELFDNIVSSLVKYMNANQAGLFLLETDVETGNKFLALKACYAYSRKKFMEKRIEIGEGLLGQCYLEKETIYLTEIPYGYVNITSGLGEATPKALVMVPLKVNDIIYGVLEIASFFALEQYQIDFVEKIAESVASVVSSVRINQRTRKLLEDSQMQSEALRAQEEEMRQNMEELTATQEEMSRKEQEYIQTIEELKAALKASHAPAS